MAFLGHAYDVELHKRGDDRRHIKTQVINALWPSVKPNSTKQGRKRFGKHLALAAHWYQVADTLGWGSLCLLPDTVSNRWAKECLAHVWSLWLQLVKHMNPNAYATSRALDA
ncbi:hypothetical protein DPSP01_014494 [Paraphaeosphaeria sporulosa]